MIARTLCLALFLLLIAAPAFGQGTFQGLTPGTSTRTEVARVLGQPVRSISATAFEYNPPAGIAKVEVAFNGAGVVERIEVYFLKPISRTALLKKFNLPQSAEARRTNAEGRLVEYFGGSSMLVLTYAASDESGGVARLAYDAPTSFNSAVAGLTGTSGSSSVGMNHLTNEPRGGTPRVGAPRVGAPRGGAPSGSEPGWTLPADTVLSVRMTTELSSKDAKVGDRISATVIAPIAIEGTAVIPAGLVIEGQVTQVAPAKRMSRPGMIAVDFNEIVFASGDRVKIVGTLTAANAQDRKKLDAEGRAQGSEGNRAVVFIGSGGAVGAAIGVINAGGKGAAIGAGAGVAAGVAVAMLAKGPEAHIHSGLQFGIQLSQPLVVKSSFLGPQQ